MLHELDVIVMATGFDAHMFVRPMELVGVDGVRLSEVWESEPFGYRSVALPGFPNVFMLIGPHSPFGNQSLFTISETQADFAMRCIERWRRGEVEAMSPTREATDRFNAEMRKVFPQTDLGHGLQELVHRRRRQPVGLALGGLAPPRDPPGARAGGLGLRHHVSSASRSGSRRRS